MKKARAIITLITLLLSPVGLGASSGTHTVLVFPFENLGTRPDINWIAEGLAEILTTRLTGPDVYALGKTERDRAYAQLGIPLSGTPLTLASEYKIAETLGVDWTVVGSFRVEGNRLTARAQLLDMRELKLASPLEATGELADLVDISTRLTWRILATHDPGFTTQSEEDFRRRFPDVRLDAFENYIRGVLAADDEARVKYWKEADRLNPADRRAAFSLGRFYFEQKDYANSAEWLRKLGAADRNYLESLFALAVDEFFLGHSAAAEKGFEALARDIPLNEVSNNLGVMKARRGRYAEALPSFERAYESDSADPDFGFNLGACFWGLKRYDDAAKVLQEAARRSNNEDPEVHAFLAVVFRKLGNAAAQRRELEWLTDHEGSPELANIAKEFVPQLRLKKNYDGRAFQLLSLTVSHELEEKLAGEPAARHSEAHLERGKAMLAEGRLAEAEKELTEAVSVLPGDSEAHLVLAQVYEAQGRRQDAVTELKISLHLRASSTAHVLLARIYLLLGRPDVARDHGQAALALEPGNREAERLMEEISRPAAAARKTP